MIENIVVDINCDFCGSKFGEDTFSTQWGWTRSSAIAEVAVRYVDKRCEACIKVHGDFKKLAEEFMEKTQKDWAEAETFVRANPKRELFDAEIVNHLPVEEVKIDSEVAV